jgi:hypothetical protein
MSAREPLSEPSPRPTINVEKVCHLVVLARQFDVKEAVIEPDPASDPADDGFRQVLEDYSDDPVVQELRDFIAALDFDEQCDIVTMMWIGRGDFDKEGWAEARIVAEQRHTEDTADYLIQTPLLADYLEEALGQFEWSCTDFEAGRL